MAEFAFRLNGNDVVFDVDPDTPLLWALRDQLGLKGTKFGCGIGMCGACTVHLGGVAVRSCVVPAAGVVGQDITTIEGIDHAVQAAWLEHQVPQCGYCQSGQIMAAVALLERDPDPTPEVVDATMSNLCRCATYDRIRQGLDAASSVLVQLRAEAEAAEAGADNGELTPGGPPPTTPTETP